MTNSSNIELLKCSQLNKWYGNLHALKNIDLTINKGEVIDYKESGIIDPTKVTRLALENAASVAGTMLTTEALVTNIIDENAPAVPGIDPSMMMQ